jgi:hypothetical protein
MLATIFEMAEAAMIAQVGSCCCGSSAAGGNDLMARIVTKPSHYDQS